MDTMTLETVRTDNQTRSFATSWTEGADRFSITATVRYDDRCRNGHNTFSITADIRRNGREYAGGCCHDEVAERFPELAPFIKWHLVSSDGPLHYVANTLYWLGKSGWCDGKPDSPPNLAHARSSAVWPDMPESFLSMTKEDMTAVLNTRLPALLAEFRAAVESFGFTF